MTFVASFDKERTDLLLEKLDLCGIRIVGTNRWCRRHQTADQKTDAKPLTAVDHRNPHETLPGMRHLIVGGKCAVNQSQFETKHAWGCPGQRLCDGPDQQGDTSA